MTTGFGRLSLTELLKHTVLIQELRTHEKPKRPYPRNTSCVIPNLPMIDHLKHNPNPQGRHCLTQNENNVEN